MIDGHKVVAVTPAGRERYLSVLHRHLLADPAVDRWDVWANTENPSDLRYLKSLEAAPKVRVVWPTWKWEHTRSIRHYYKDCVDPDTVYVRIDDDVVWIEPGAVGKLVRSRLEDPDPLVVYGTIVNCPLNSYYHQGAGLIPHTHGTCRHEWTDKVGWGTGAFAVELHERFLAAPDPRAWHLHDRVLGYDERMAVNVVSWTGRDGRSWCHEVAADEEAWLACDMPKHLGRANRAVGDAVFVHYAYFPQRDAVDAVPSILSRYKGLCP